MRLVPIESVREGSLLAKTIYGSNGTILLKEGAMLSAAIIARLKYMQIYLLYIKDDYTTEVIEDIIKPELRQKSIKIIKNTFNRIALMKEALQKKDSSSSKVFSTLKENDDYFASIHEVAQELIDNILSNKDILVNLVDIKSMDNYTYQHCVNTAVLSLCLGIAMKLNKYELRDLCVGALVHDLGKVLISKDIILKSNTLSDDEFEEMKTHALKGYEYLRNTREISITSKMIVLQHHERYDGRGYPGALKGEEINKLARLVSIADVYDALTSDRPYRRSILPSEAMEYIMASSGTLFDPHMVFIFSRVIVPYSNGTIVRLSNGDIGIVQETPLNFPLRPNVKILKSKDTSKVGRLVELVKEISVVISSIEYSV